VNGNVMINGKDQGMPEHAQHHYNVYTNGNLFGENSVTAQGTHALSNFKLLDELDIYVSEAGKLSSENDTTIYQLNMPADVADRVSKLPGVYRVRKKIDPPNYYSYQIFPHSPSYPWNNDNFGPLLIPKKGMTIPVDTHNLCLYQKVMNTYDDGIHQVYALNGQVFYDGQPITSYTFKQDYYFMMGDNRHNSADSRSWGFVPYDHVVGSPFFVWFSMKYAENNPISGKSVIGSLFKNSKNGKFRWDRFLCYVENGKLHSVKIPFILAVLAIWGYSKWNQKRRRTKTQKPSAG
jgi:signal peptidase I